MIRGTTPSITYAFELEFDDVIKLTATFTDQATNEECFKLEKERFKYANGEITAVLTQAETLSLKRGVALTQLKVQTLDGNVFASNIVPVSVSKILDEVIFE